MPVVSLFFLSKFSFISFSEKFKQTALRIERSLKDLIVVFNCCLLRQLIDVLRSSHS